MVNDVPKIHTKRDGLSVETHCIVANKEENGFDLRIPMRLDGIFFYFPTYKLSEEEIDNCEYMGTLQLCPEGDDCNPQDKSFVEREDSHTDYKGDLIDHPAKRCQLIEVADVGDIHVLVENYEYPIRTVMVRNYDGIDEPMLEVINPQDMDVAFLMDDDFMQGGSADLSACFNEELLRKR